MEHRTLRERLEGARWNLPLRRQAHR
jgi:hypothetical protein